MMSKKVHFARLPFRICPLAETHRFGHGCLSSKRCFSTRETSVNPHTGVYIF